jgi:hypothetical protein
MIAKIIAAPKAVARQYPISEIQDRLCFTVPPSTPELRSNAA